MVTSSSRTPPAVGVIRYTTSRLSSSSDRYSCDDAGSPPLCLRLGGGRKRVGSRSCSSGPTSVCQLKVPGGRTSGIASPRASRRVRHGTKPYVCIARMADLQNGA